MTDTGSAPAGFNGLVAGLATTAAATLSHVEEQLAPAEGAKADSDGPSDADTREKLQRGLANAKHLIDTLAMLEQKTSGNLTPEERKFLQAALTQLRITFVHLNDRLRAGGSKS